MAEISEDLRQHSGRKYIRRVWATGIGGSGHPQEMGFVDVDFYDIVNALAVTNPAVQHALKKLMYCGRRNKGDEVQDLREARDAITRAIQMVEAENLQCPTTTAEYDSTT